MMGKQTFYRRKTKASWKEAVKTIAHTVFWGALWVAILIGIYESWLALYDPQILPIRQVDVIAGDLHVSQAELKKQVYSNLQGTLLSLDKRKLKKALLQLPWVENVSIRRIWPDKIVIKISEQVAIAQWGQTSLLNKELDLFSPLPATFPSDLPILFGPEKAKADLWEKYQELSQRFAPLKLKVVAVELSPRASWSFKLSNEAEVIWGREDLDERLKHLIRLYPRLIAERQGSIALIDLRYPNGFSIKWKDEEKQITH